MLTICQLRPNKNLSGPHSGAREKEREREERIITGVAWDEYFTISICLHSGTERGSTSGWALAWCDGSALHRELPHITQRVKREQDNSTWNIIIEIELSKIQRNCLRLYDTSTKRNSGETNCLPYHAKTFKTLVWLHFPYWHLFSSLELKASPT